MRACDYSVYRFKYSRKEAVRLSTFGGMDSEFSHYETKEREYLCVAPDEFLAKFLFSNRHKNDDELELLKIECVGQLNDLLYLQ